MSNQPDFTVRIDDEAETEEVQRAIEALKGVNQVDEFSFEERAKELKEELQDKSPIPLPDELIDIVDEVEDTDA